MSAAVADVGVGLHDEVVVNFVFHSETTSKFVVVVLDVHSVVQEVVGARCETCLVV